MKRPNYFHNKFNKIPTVLYRASLLAFACLFCALSIPGAPFAWASSSAFGDGVSSKTENIAELDNIEDSETTEDPEVPDDAEEHPSIFIQAINPGYTKDGKANVGEFIELRRLSDTPISLAGLFLRYTNSSGKSSNLYQFPEDSQMVGETLLLRLASSPDASKSDSTYKKSLSFGAGPLELVHLDTVISSVCWTGRGTCLQKFNGRAPTIIVRNKDGKFSHQTGYEPHFDPAKPGLFLPPPEISPDETPVSQCRGLGFSEILTYFESSKSEQFVELYNPTAHNINLHGCALKYRNKKYYLSGEVRDSDYFIYSPESFTFTKNPTSENRLELIDTTEEVLDTLIIPHGQKKAASLAQFAYSPEGKEQWLQTYRPTPESPNIFQGERTCPSGRAFNADTGNCVKIANVKQPKPCPAGQYRDSKSGRCRKPKPIKTAKPCQPGYERGPSGRCRKIRQNTGANHPFAPELKTNHFAFVAVGAVIAIVLAALGFVAFQFRHELAHLLRRIKSKLRLRKTPPSS